MENNKIKLIFLDVDGVINCKNTTTRHQGYIGIDPFLVMIFNRIILATDAKIVISSAWRLFPQGVEEIERRTWKSIGVTPKPRTGFRGGDINDWLAAHPEIEIDKYAILDDDSDFYPDQPLFKTTWENGLTEEIAAKVIEHLNSK